MSGNNKESRKSAATPHDAAFKAAFQKRKVARSFFRHYFPEQVVKLIDFRHLKLNNRSYVDEKFKEKHSDIVYRAKIRGSVAFLYILFEHQSKPDYWIAFRLLCYMTNLWREVLEQNPQAKKLPVILPAVLYHGRQKWNCPRSFVAMIEAGEGLEKYIPDFSYDLYNLREYEDERLLIGDAMALGVVLYLMKHIFDKDFGSHIEHSLKLLGKIEKEESQLEFLEWMLRYVYNAREDNLNKNIDRGLDALNNVNARKVAMTIAERIKQEGRVEGRMMLIRKQLNKRFGEMSPDLEKKLKDSELDLLDQFGEALFDFNNLKEAERWWDNFPKEGNA
jgi:predicted transposase/invertase (TIGR01784 family)